MNRKNATEPDASASVAVRIEELIFGCVEVGASLRRIGDISAANYVDGAGLSLRIASAANAAHLPLNTLDAVSLDSALATRALEDGSPGSAITPARRTQPDLGVNLVGFEGAREMFGDPLGSALLEDALWRWVWLHQEARTQWQTTREGARAIVAILTDGRPPVDLGRGMGGRVDGEVLRCLAGLGWAILPDQIQPERPN